MKYKLFIDKQGLKGYYKIDGFEGYVIDDMGNKKPKRYRESIGLFKYLKPKGPIERQHNKKIQTLADEILATKNLAYMQSKFGLSNHDKRDMLFIDYMETYIKQNNSSINDLQIFDIVKNHLIKYNGRGTRIQDIDYKFCKNFAQYLLSVKKQTGKALSSSTMDSYYKKFQLVLKEIVREKILPTNPAKEVKILPKVVHKERVFLTDDELKKLIETDLPQTNLKKFFLLSCFTGLRHSDCKNLKWKDVKEIAGGFNEAGTEVITTTYEIKVTMQKTKEHITIPVTDDCMKVLGERKGDDDYVITGLKYSGRANQLIETWGYKAGIKKTLTPHIARHTFATRFIRESKDVYTLMHLLGHKDISTTQTYLHLVDEEKRKQMDKLKKLMPDE